MDLTSGMILDISCVPECFLLCVCTYSNDRYKAAIWWVGKRIVKHVDPLTFCGVVTLVCTRARARALSFSPSVFGSQCLSLYLSVCLSVGEYPRFVFLLSTLRICLREGTCLATVSDSVSPVARVCYRCGGIELEGSRRSPICSVSSMTMTTKRTC